MKVRKIRQVISLSVGNYLHLKGEVLGTYSSHKIKFQFTAENII